MVPSRNCFNDTEAVCLSGDELAGAVGGWVGVGVLLGLGANWWWWQ